MGRNRAAEPTERAAERSGRVLVVDDDRRIRALLGEVLTHEGYDVREAANGLEALGVLEEWKPDVITIGLRMPEMDGPTFLSERRRRGPCGDVPVIVLTASSHLRAEVSHAEAAAFLTKPFVPRVLLDTIDEVRRRCLVPRRSPSHLRLLPTG